MRIDQPQIVDVAVFDLHHFNRQTCEDAALQAEILGLFRTQLDDVQKALREQPTAASWRLVFHTLKGAAAAVGARGISELASEFELNGMARDAQARAAQLQRLDKAISAFRSVAVQD